jgi:hypothetical protein
LIEAFGGNAKAAGKSADKKGDGLTRYARRAENSAAVKTDPTQNTSAGA